MKSVCSKHEQAFELECPYCEKKAEGPTAAPLVVVSPFAKAVDARIQTVKDMIAKGLLYGIPAGHPLWAPGTAPPPLMNFDACSVCGKSGLEIMQAGHTYKTHPCFGAAP